MSETGARDVLPPLSFDLAKEAMAIHLQSPVFSEKENAGNTIGSLDELTTINRNGLITINSQEGVISQGFNEESKRFWKIKERGYLTGFMRLSRGGKFINWINSNTDKIAFLTSIVNYEDFEATFTRRDAYRGSAPLESFFPSIAVTLQGSSETSFEDIVNLFSFSHVPLITTQSSLDSEKKEARLKKEEEVILITLIDPIYGRLCKSPEGLYADVMKGLAAVPDDVSSSNGAKKGGTRRKSRPVNKLPAINENSKYNLGYNNITNAFIKKFSKSPPVNPFAMVNRFAKALKEEDVRTLLTTLEDPTVKRLMESSPITRNKVQNLIIREALPKPLTVKMRKTRRLRR
jgi:hypothetical protein